MSFRTSMYFSNFEACFMVCDASGEIRKLSADPGLLIPFFSFTPPINDAWKSENRCMVLSYCVNSFLE